MFAFRLPFLDLCATRSHIRVHQPIGMTILTSHRRAPDYVPPRRPYSFAAMLSQILSFAAFTLVDNGRLCMWMPTANEDVRPEDEKANHVTTKGTHGNGHTNSSSHHITVTGPNIDLTTGSADPNSNASSVTSIPSIALDPDPAPDPARTPVSTPVSSQTPVQVPAPVPIPIPTHPSLRLLSVSVQDFNRWSRRLLTYTRLPDSEIDAEALEKWESEDGTAVGTADELNGFRKRFFEGFR